MLLPHVAAPPLPLPALWLVPVLRGEDLHPVDPTIEEEGMPLTSCLDTVLLLMGPEIDLTFTDSLLTHFELSVREEPWVLFTNIAVRKPHFPFPVLPYLFFPDRCSILDGGHRGIL